MPLLGVPFGVKNLFDIKNHVTLAGSKINKRNGAALQDALLIRRLENCGAILVGALNMGEYAYDFTGETYTTAIAEIPGTRQEWPVAHLLGVLQ